MIDILLVLLIAAILWALPGWRTDVQLPVPVTDPGPHIDAPSIVLSVLPGPAYAINRRPVSRRELIPELARIYAGRPDKVLFIDGARSVPYQEVFWLYGAVKDAGVTVTAIVPPETRRPDAQPTPGTSSSDR
jgi:biopolymer transport protein ExbD